MSLVADQNSSSELLCEAVITLGSFAHGKLHPVVQMYAYTLLCVSVDTSLLSDMYR